MKKNYLKVMLVVALGLLLSCEKEGKQTDDGDLLKGVLVLNEGAYGGGNASISWIDSETDSLRNEVFRSVNNRPLGDVLQSVCVGDEKFFLIVNASNKIEVVDQESFSEVGVITELDGPRSMVLLGSKAYVSQWGLGGVVQVINLDSYQVENTIEVGSGPEALLSINGAVWVANGGGFGTDSTLSVIDTATGTVAKTIQVGHNPKEMVLDNEGNVWVLCIGSISYNADWTIAGETPARVFKIDSDSYTVTRELIVATHAHPQHLDISPDGKTIYYGGGFGVQGIFALADDATTGPGELLIDKMVYGFNVDPEEGHIYACEAPSFTENGRVIRYTAEGAVQVSMEVGIGPNGVVFVR